ncbi:MAG: hypothetical protein H7246_14075, partial [Phycisphaerae bacterium]|nr:hypothetical protein [Saprospiraceae bacterium]
MNKILLAATSVVLLTLLVFALQKNTQTTNLPSFAKATAGKPADKQSPEPSDYLWAQRAFPYGSVPSEAYYAALEQVQNQAQARDNALVWE